MPVRRAGWASSTPPSARRRSTPTGSSACWPEARRRWSGRGRRPRTTPLPAPLTWPHSPSLPDDAVVGIAASGRTPYTIGAVRHAAEVGALTIGISSNPDAELSRYVDHPIELVTGPEVIAGSTRLKAGTAQKVVLNIISTIAMVRLGKTFGNLMVDVRATNAKLRDRARRIVADAAGVSPSAAAAALDAAAGDVKVAIVMLLTGADAAEASRSSRRHRPRRYRTASSDAALRARASERAASGSWPGNE